MFRPIARITSLHARSLARPTTLTLRTLHTSPFLRDDTGPDKTLTEGHVADKSQQTLHKDGDVQSAAVRAAKNTKTKVESGKDEPGFDAATMGNEGGKSKAAEGTGALKDQVGGQDLPGKSGEMGGTEEAAGDGVMDFARKLTGLGPEKNTRSFSTSARQTKDPQSTPKARKTEPSSNDKSKLHGDQNPHLKHKTPGIPDKGKGNAGVNPSLPSKSNIAKGKAGFATSARVGATKPPRAQAHTGEAGDAGYGVPGEAIPSTLESAYSPSATPPADPNAIPSSEAYSSTGSAPTAGDRTLQQQAKEGGLAERNPPPEPKYGEIGLDDGWKARDKQ